MEFSSEFIEKIFKYKFEFSLLIRNDNEDNVTYELLNLNSKSKKKDKLYPQELNGNYNEYVEKHIKKFIEKKDNRILSRFDYLKLIKLIDPVNGYSFDCDFLLNNERLNKKFSFFEDRNNIVMLVEDNTAYKAEQTLELLKNIDSASLLYEIKNDNYNIIYVSEQFANLVENDSNTIYKLLQTSHPFDYVDDKDINKLSDLLYGNEKNGYHTSAIFDMKTLNKKLNVKASISFYLLGKKLYAHIIFEDISDILKLHQVTDKLNSTLKTNAELNHENMTDPLTNLGNDAKHKKFVAELNERIKQGFKEYAVCSCDVNGLKHTNDTYGHSYGGSLIAEAGHVFPKYFKTSELFHVGGDEFVLIILGDDFRHFDEILSRLRNVLEFQPYEFRGQTLHLSVAIGSSKFQEGDKEYNDTFQRADDEMYVKKTDIKARHHIEGR